MNVVEVGLKFCFAIGGIQGAAIDVEVTASNMTDIFNPLGNTMATRERRPRPNALSWPEMLFVL